MSKEKIQISDLKLVKNVLSYSIFDVNNTIDFSEWYKTNDLEIKLESEFAIKKNDNSSAKLSLTLELFDTEFREENKPFYLKVKMNFLFIDTEGFYDEKNNVIEKFNLNMVSIAYPYLRSYVSTITAISGMEQIHIPTINVFKTLVKKED
ncbi:hypothetical protein ACR6L3_001840 [Enterococcus faecalis]|nr:protein-export chaperone SecB [Enterococcus faecalis]